VKHVVATCPICAGSLAISRLSCENCDTRIETELPLPAFMRLPRELQEFVLLFLRCRGSIRDMEKELNVSYPTVCKRLDLINDLLEADASGPRRRPSAATRGEILAKLERGEITAKEAAELLKGT
jgi:hypothetical protein